MIALCAAVGTLALLVGADRLVARLAPGAAGLVLPPATRIHYETDEFSFDAESNALGYRGPELAAEKSRWRVVALGDSFTYGWGVAEREAWPAVLEQRLRSAGVEVEIANLGQGGVATAEYARIAERAVPALRPDLVLVGVLQGDDLAQAVEARAPEGGAREAVKGALELLAPELLAHLRAARTSEELDIRAHWRAQAQGYLTSMSADTERWYRALPAPLRESFESGGLNPGLVTMARAEPGHLMHTLELETAATRAAIEDMAAHLARIRDLGAPVLVVSIPHAAFVSEANRGTYRALGFQLGEDCATTSAMDSATARAAELAGVEFVALTECYRPAAAERELFFLHDGHPNADGYAQLADCLLPFIEALRDRP